MLFWTFFDIHVLYLQPIFRLLSVTISVSQIHTQAKTQAKPEKSDITQAKTQAKPN